MVDSSLVVGFLVCALSLELGSDGCLLAPANVRSRDDRHSGKRKRNGCPGSGGTPAVWNTRKEFQVPSFSFLVVGVHVGVRRFSRCPIGINSEDAKARRSSFLCVLCALWLIPRGLWLVVVGDRFQVRCLIDCKERKVRKEGGREALLPFSRGSRFWRL